MNNNPPLNFLPKIREEGYNIKAFTLVELIVVITILAILGTIAFISLQGYSATSRDSVRISDMSSIKSSLELFNIDAGKYPNTSSGVSVTFSGGILRTQGTFGESTFKNVTKLDKIPKDPLTDIEYTYSVTNTKQEYEIAGIMEGDDISMLNETYAAQKIAKAMVTGHYNGKIAKVFTDGKTYVLAVPTIISGSGYTLESIMVNKSFVYNGYSNLPLNYNGSSYNTLGETNLNLVDSTNYIVFSGSLSDLTNPKDATSRILMLENLQKAYTGSVIQDSAITEILAITDFSTTNPIAVNLAGTVVNNTLGASIATTSTDNTPEIVINTTPPTDYIAYYPLTGTAEDKTGNYNGTENGGLTYISDVTRGSVASFDGADDYINTQLNLEGSAFSYSFWIKTDGTDMTYIIGQSSGSSVLGPLLDYNGQKLYFRLPKGDGNDYFNIVSNSNLPLNEFVYITTTWDGTLNTNGVKIYINGILDSEGTSSSNATLTYLNPLYIASERQDGGSYYSKFQMSNTRIFNRALSQQEITNIYNTEKDTSPVAVSDGLVAYYPLKNNSMDNWYNQYDGSDFGGISYIGNIAEFNGTDSSVTLPAYLKTNLSSNEFSVSTWINSNSIPLITEFPYIAGATTSLASSMISLTTDGNVKFSVVDTSYGWHNLSSPINNNEWVHLVGIKTINGIKFYVNNILIDSESLIYSTIAVNNSISLGNWYDQNDKFFNGKISNFRTYNKVLSELEIGEIYNTEKGDFGL